MAPWQPDEAGDCIDFLASFDRHNLEITSGADETGAHYDEEQEIEL